MKIVAANKGSSEIIGAGWHIDKWAICMNRIWHDLAGDSSHIRALVSGPQLWEVDEVLLTIAAACSPR